MKKKLLTLLVILAMAMTVAFALTACGDNLNPTPDAPTPAAVTWSSGLTLAGVTLPDGWTWVEPTTALSVGTANHPANFELAGYESATDIAVSVTVNPAAATNNPPTTTAVTWTEGLTLADITLPAGWTWAAPATALNASAAAQTFQANFALANHAPASNVAVSVTVNYAAAPSVSAPTLAAQTWTADLVLGDFDLGTNWAWAAPATSLNAGANQNFNAVYTRPNHLPTGEIQVSVTVNPAATPSTPTFPTVVIWTEGMTLNSAFPLTGGWTWAEPTTVLNTSAAAQTFYANFALANHTSANNVNVLVTVNRANQSGVTAVLNGWTYGATANDPATAGTIQESAAVTFEYSATQNFATVLTERPVNAGTWYVRAQLAQTANHNAFTTPAVEFVIAQATPDPTVPTNLAVFTGFGAVSLEDVALPANWAWNTPLTSLSGTTDTIAVATYTPANTNFAAVQVYLTVEKAYFVDIEIATGAVFGAASMALDNMGRVWTWGNNPATIGGHGITGLIPIPRMITQVYTQSTGTASLSLGDSGFPFFTQISLNHSNSGEGGIHALALCYYGHIWSWGNNNGAGTGHGFNESTTTARPRKITIFAGVSNTDNNPTFQMAYVRSTGGAALCYNGYIWTWGTPGNAGHGEGTEMILSPTRITAVYNDDATGTISVGASGFPTFVMAHARQNNGAAICTNGYIWTWGSNANNRTGHGGAAGTTTRPRRIMQIQTTDSTTANLLTATGIEFVDVRMGAVVTMAICYDGGLWTWGAGYNGHAANPVLPRLVTNFAGVADGDDAPVAVMTARGNLTVGAFLDSEGNIWVVGSNAWTFNTRTANSMTGLGLTEGSITTFTRIEYVSNDGSIDNYIAAPKFKSISIGCLGGGAVCINGRLWTWGANIGYRTGHGISTADGNDSNTYRPRSISEGWTP